MLRQQLAVLLLASPPLTPHPGKHRKQTPWCLTTRTTGLVTCHFPWQVPRAPGTIRGAYTHACTSSLRQRRALSLAATSHFLMCDSSVTVYIWAHKAWLTYGQRAPLIHSLGNPHSPCADPSSSFSILGRGRREARIGLGAVTPLVEGRPSFSTSRPSSTPSSSDGEPAIL